MKRRDLLLIVPMAALIGQVPILLALRPSDWITGALLGGTVGMLAIGYALWCWRLNSARSLPVDLTRGLSALRIGGDSGHLLDRKRDAAG